MRNLLLCQLVCDYFSSEFQWILFSWNFFLIFFFWTFDLIWLRVSTRFVLSKKHSQWLNILSRFKCNAKKTIGLSNFLLNSFYSADFAVFVFHVNFIAIETHISFSINCFFLIIQKLFQTEYRNIHELYGESTSWTRFFLYKESTSWRIEWKFDEFNSLNTFNSI